MKNPHFLIAKEGADAQKLFPKAFIGKVDGQKAASLKDFLEEIGEALEFPDYDGKNLDALDEMLNDLEWIEQEKVIIYISHTADWLSKEKSQEKVLTLIDLLDATAEDWHWLDEEEDVAKKSLIIVLEDSQRIRELLESQEITFALV
jgi:RNAse (barnase) inhibitor barstar